MQTKAADPSYREFRVQPGIIDLEHLELVALESFQIFMDAALPVD